MHLEICAIAILVLVLSIEAKPNPENYENVLEDRKTRSGGALCSFTEFTCRDETGCLSRSDFCDSENECEDGSDESTDICPPDCSNVNQFKCLSGECISRRFKCNNVNDCSDMSDELNCVVNCSSTEFACNNRFGCLKSSHLCNFHNDCRDGSDESLTLCPTDCSHVNQFKCCNDVCIARRLVCNFDDDCGDLSDELDCETYVCPDYMAKCDNSFCIDADFVCDSIDDCHTGWDERNCTS